MESVKYSRIGPVEIFTTMVHRSLSMRVGSKHSALCRHIAAIGPRFRLLSIGLSLLQGDTLANGTAKNVLRERIYAAVFDYFRFEFSILKIQIKIFYETLEVIIVFVC